MKPLADIYADDNITAGNAIVRDIIAANKRKSIGYTEDDILFDNDEVQNEIVDVVDKKKITADRQLDDIMLRIISPKK